MKSDVPLGVSAFLVLAAFGQAGAVPNLPLALYHYDLAQQLVKQVHSSGDGAND